MPYLWFAVGFIGFFILDTLLNDDQDDRDDDGSQPPHRTPPAMGGDSASVPLEKLNLHPERCISEL